jgi:antitoxin PrlF
MGVYDSTLTSKGQTTIPAEIREALNLKPGDKIRYVMSGDRVYLRVKNGRLADLAGFLGRPPNAEGVSIEEIDDAIMDAVAEDDERIVREWRDGSK